MSPESKAIEIEDLRQAVTVAGMQVDDVVAPSNNHVILRNRRFHYLDWGGPGVVPIVFLHGGGLTAHTWDLVCLALRPNYRCYALDLRGHGDSEWSSDMNYTFEAHAGDVDAFVQYLALKAPVIIGMSLGGGTAVRYSSEHTPQALVLVDTGPLINRSGSRWIRDFMRQPAELDSIEEFVTRSMQFNPRRDPRLLRRSLLHNLVQLPDGKWTWKYDRRHYGRPNEENQAIDREKVWAGVNRITCPVLVVRGQESEVFSRAKAQALAESLMHGRWVEVPDAGHTVQGDNPKDLSREILMFLADTKLEPVASAPRPA